MPILASAHYSCHDSAVGLAGRQLGAVGQKLSYTTNVYVDETLCTHTHTRFDGPLSRTTRVSRYQKGKQIWIFTEARDSEWQWHQLGHMQVCTSLQTDNYASTTPLTFLQSGCPSCRPTNSVKALKATDSLCTVLIN